MKRKLRVLHIGNGAAFKIRAIIDGLRERGHENHMIPVPSVPSGFEGVAWHSLPESSLPGRLGTFHRMLRIRRLANRLKPDIVHAHNAWGPGWLGAGAGHHPFVIHAYGGDLLPEQYQGRGAVPRGLTAWACRKADRIVVTGEHMIGAARHLDIAPGKVALIPRGVDVKLYRPALDTVTLRTTLGLGNAGPIVFSPRYQVDESLYNLDLIIEAFAQIRARFPAAVCLQMCDPKREAGVKRLAALAAGRGLGDSYRLVPAVDNATMPLFYNLADIAVSVPSSDGFPVTVLEASACECPLVVSDLPYCKEWFIPGENGVIVPVGDVPGLARAMTELLADEPLRRGIGAAGRKLVEHKANYDTCMDTLEAMYLDLLGHGAKSRETA